MGTSTGRSSGPRIGSPDRRQRVLLWAVLVVLAVFAARLVQVQVFEGPALAAQAREERQRTVTLHADRGEILDADGMVLATSVVRYDVVIDQRQVPAYVHYSDDKEILGRGAVAAAEQLSPLLGVPAHELGAQLTGTSGYVRLAKDVTPEVRDQIEQMSINGLTTHSTTKRTYPQGTTAGNVVGWVNYDQAEENRQYGAAGLEFRLNTELEGTNGARHYETGVGGTVIPGAAQSVDPAQDGRTVHTSIDVDLQFACQQAIDAQVDATGAEWGAVTVIEVKTGRVLALCDSDTTDPNAPTGAGAVRSVTSPYEPGSTGKILTVAAAINEGLVTPESTFNVPDRITMPNGQSFKDAFSHETWPQATTAGIMAVSSNTGTIQIGDLLTDAKRVEYMERFGWADPTGIEIAGETGGTNLDPSAWDGRTRYVTMFGQANQVNLLQITNVVATLANGGVRLPLHVVDGYTDAGGRYTPAEHGEGVEVVTPETADQMMLMLEGVTAAERNTGKKAQIEGYRVAGKTGTAQVPDASGALTKTAASFVGAVPADDPELAIGVIIFKPASGQHGGAISAPVFQQVGSAALQMLGIPPTGTQAQLYDLGFE